MQKAASSKENKKVYKPSLLKALIRQFGLRYASLGLITFIEECILRIVQPLFMSKLISLKVDRVYVISLKSALRTKHCVRENIFYVKHPDFCLKIDFKYT